MAGVSQATVSLVLNGPDRRRRRASRRRPASACCGRSRETGYVADPVARRLAAAAQPDPRRLHLRAGLPQREQRLLPPVPGRHRAARRGARLRPAAVHQRPGGRRRGGGSSTRTTGCGWPTAASCSVATIDRDELARLVAEGFPFVVRRPPRRRRRPGALRRRRLRRGGRARWSTGPRRSATAAGLPGHGGGRGVARPTACAASARPWPPAARRPCTSRPPARDSPTTRSTSCSPTGVTAVFVEEHGRRASRWRRPRGAGGA